MADTKLMRQHPSAGIPVVSTAGGGVVASHRDEVGMAVVLARKGQVPALAEKIRERFGIELPRGPRRSAGGDIAIAGISPEGWLATRDRDCNGFAEYLVAALGELASVSDQSDGYALLRLTGPKVLDALARILPIDLHARAFRAGDVASTVASGVVVTTWRVDYASGGPPIFDLAIPRSFLRSFWHALGDSAAEFGLLTAGPTHE